MPLVKRSEADMLRFASFTDVIVQPVNAVGRMESGLAGAFAKRWPDMVPDYKSLCEQGLLKIGDLVKFHDAKSKNIIVNMVTKRDWRDHSTEDDIEKACISLAEYLREHPFYTVVMPAFGTGSGPLDPVFCEDVLMSHLDPLPNIIHLAMRPDRFAKPPIYLAVVGSRAYTDFDRIDLGVTDAMIEFGLGFPDLDAMVSGGAKGVDAVACGTGRPGDNTLTVAQQHGVRPIICHADWDRYGNSAGFVRNRTVQDIATHVVAFVGSKSVGTRMMIDLVNRYNDNIDRLQETQLTPADGDVFDRPYTPLPRKQKLFICDVSKMCV